MTVWHFSNGDRQIGVLIFTPNQWTESGRYV